jgi:hypothetical protein
MSKSAVAGVVRAMVWRLADLQAERGLWAEGRMGQAADFFVSYTSATGNTPS